MGGGLKPKKILLPQFFTFHTSAQASLALVWNVKKAVRCTADFLWFAER